MKINLSIDVATVLKYVKIKSNQIKQVKYLIKNFAVRGKTLKGKLTNGVSQDLNIYRVKIIFIGSVSACFVTCV